MADDGLCCCDKEEEEEEFILINELDDDERLCVIVVPLPYSLRDDAAAVVLGDGEVYDADAVADADADDDDDDDDESGDEISPFWTRSASGEYHIFFSYLFRMYFSMMETSASSLGFGGALFSYSCFALALPILCMVFIIDIFMFIYIHVFVMMKKWW